MNFTIEFFITNILLGVGLAMDAFSVSVANGLNEPFMRKRKMLTVSGVFAFFQFMMPLIGFICVSTLIGYFKVFEKFIPYIARGLLAFIGGKMIADGIKCDCPECSAVGVVGLIVQGIATSIDALSVGFTIAEYDWFAATVAALLIALVTFILCAIGIFIGQKAGTRLAGKAGILGGVILIAIGLEIFITGMI